MEGNVIVFKGLREDHSLRKYSVFAVLSLSLFTFNVWMDVWMGETIKTSLHKMLGIFKAMSLIEYFILFVILVPYFTSPFVSKLIQFLRNRNRT
ncbi:hypothetical protein PSAB_15185 [Paenibacillus sabinae T27]|uniref:Uncharacterized protein n=1 Tax=Paenibacillus sabinae T27 TaxID=1268072 RepID=X5A297_9BACL|nr:hypothetical protein PSAB_15185 [Paenibacillus sabinae T27]